MIVTSHASRLGQRKSMVTRRRVTPLTFAPTLWLRHGVGILNDTAAQFASVSSKYFSHAGNADLRGVAAGFWRAMHVYVQLLDTDRVLMSTWNSATNTGYEIYLGNDNLFYVKIGYGTGTTTKSFTGTTVELSTWYHVYVSVSGTTISISVNAATPQTETLGGTFSPGSGVFHLGATIIPDTFFNGRLDSVFGGDTPDSAIAAACYNGATGVTFADLTAAQKTDWGLLFAYDMDQALGLDSQGTADLTPVNGPTIAQGIAAGAASNGDPISTWQDQSGYGNHFTQTTISKQPIYDTAVGINGHAVLDYNGTSHYLERSTRFMNDAECTLFVAWEPDVLAGTPINVSVANVANRYWIPRIRSGTFQPEILALNADTQDSVYGSTALGMNTPYVCALKTEGNIWSMRVNGAAQSLTVAAGVNDGTGNSHGTDRVVGTISQTIGMAKYNSTFINYFNGGIGDIVYYPRALTADTMDKIDDYLGRDFEIAIT